MFYKNILKIIILFFLFIFFINASSDNDAYLLKDPVNVDKNSLTIEALRNKVFPDVKIIIEKFISDQKYYKSYLVSYKVDSLKLYALMNVPNSKKPERGFPVVIVNHGYIPQSSYSTINSYKLVTGYFASSDFLVLKPDYRGFAESEEGERNILSRLNYVIDVIYLLNGISSIPEADKNNIFMYGHSMGGDVTLRVLEITNKIKAATLWAPVSAMFPENAIHYFKKSDNNPDDLKKLNDILDKYFTQLDFLKMSALSNVKYIKTPLILHHGTRDESVPYNWSINLMKKFDEAKVNYKFYSYEDEDS